MMIEKFVAWLADTPVSLAIGDHAWITPTVQTVHILAIAIVMSAILMTNLKALGAVGHDDTLLGFSQLYAPWICGALIVLLFSGATLIVGEPRRSLENPVFILKMVLLCIALLLTAAIHAPLRRNAAFWGTARRGGLLRGMALLSLGVWAAIVFSGRWIAYAVT